MMMTRQRGGGVTLPGIISLELCQGWYLFLEAPTLSRHCPGGRAIQPGIHNLLLYERRLPDQRLHALMKYLCVCVYTNSGVCMHKFLLVFIFCVCVYERRLPDPRLHFNEIYKHKYKNTGNACKNQHSFCSQCKLSGEQHSSNIAGKFLSSSIFFSSSILTCHMSYAW